MRRRLPTVRAAWSGFVSAAVPRSLLKLADSDRLVVYAGVR
jgi:hypothetical protein